MRSVFLSLNLRILLTRFIGVRKWVVGDEEVARIADQLRQWIRGSNGIPRAECL
jgi:hypothetical protein